MTIPARCPICLAPTTFECPDKIPGSMGTHADGVLKVWCNKCINQDDKEKRERRRVANELDWHMICPPE